MCQALAQQAWGGMTLPLPALDDAEGAGVPAGLEVVDAHVHLFPPRVYEAIWRWFEDFAWPIRYKLYAEQTVDFLASRGVKRLVGLHYSHTPGMARLLNRHAAELAATRPIVWPLGTVLPGEPEAEAIAVEALEELGLKGLKLHCHVQRFAVDDPVLDPVWKVCVRNRARVVVHAGREPALPAYKADIATLCHVDAMRRLLARWPDLVVIVPHLGADEITAYLGLLDDHLNLWLDTTMMLADYFPQAVAGEWLEQWGDRILYGSDFPNLPYAWDRELKRLVSLGLAPATLAAIAGGNAARAFGFPQAP